MLREPNEWNLDDLHKHLQFAVELELWTIPYYMVAMYSIIDRTSAAFRGIRSVLIEEMLHLQCISNMANAYEYQPKLCLRPYGCPEIPHLDFALDDPDPRAAYSPWSTELGAFDEKRMNTMCLIEYPEWKTSRNPQLRSEPPEYGNIAELYAALKSGAGLLTRYLRGHRNQVDHFSAYYRGMPSLTIDDDGETGFQAFASLADLIREHGEGANPRIASQEGMVSTPYRNTADATQGPVIDEVAWSHFRRFSTLRGKNVNVHRGRVQPDHPLNLAWRDQLARLLRALEQLFSGRDHDNFAAVMFSTGAALQNCWRANVIPSL